MSQHLTTNTSGLHSTSGTNPEPTCSLIPGIDGDLQVVHSRTGHILFDVQSVHFDVDGNQRDDHSTIRLTHDAVLELRALLDRISEPQQPVRPSIWSDATFSRPVHTQRTRSKRRAVA